MLAALDSNKAEIEAAMQVGAWPRPCTHLCAA